MELQWDKTQFPCLWTKVHQVQNQEQTLEVRLGDEMPDIGRIICGWGQSIVRGKEWQGDSMSISGGIMAWVLYAPEDGSAPRCVESWLPYSMKWNFPQSQRDGTIRADVKVRNVDARVLSARKMMIRASVSAMGEALEPGSTEVYKPAQEHNVQLLLQTYPLTVPAEAGEKVFLVDEDVEIPGKKPEKIITYHIEPNLTEQKVVGTKAVFRGDCQLHLVYFAEDGSICSADASVPFAQYSELDRDYDKEAGIHTLMAVSSLEPEWIDGLLRLKCGLVAQYVILENCLLSLAQDAYSTQNQLQAAYETLEIPVALDRRTEMQTVSQSAPSECTEIVDITCCWEHPVLHRSGMTLDAQMPGVVQVLCKDTSDQYSCVSIRCSYQWSLPAAEESTVGITANCGTPEVRADGTNMHVNAPVELEMLTTARQEMPMITGLELGPQTQPDPNRPSMILRRADGGSLWNMAKQYGSTVDAIRSANGIEEQPTPGQMVLIPVS